MKKLYFIVLFVCSTVSYALQGGPTQPDYIEFEPYEMKDMVSLVSGNFAYSIPLSEVPGPYGSYPLSISYHAGISPQKEASWVGLGWTLSPGSILRDVRGVPDDQFHGGTLGFIYQYSSFFTWSLETAYSNGPYSVGVGTSSTGGTGASATYGVKIAECATVGLTVDTRSGIGSRGSLGFGSYGLNVSAMYSFRSGDWSFGAGFGYGEHLETSLGVQYTTGQDASFSVGMSSRFKNLPTTLSLSSNGSVGIQSKSFDASISKKGASISSGPVSASIRKGGASVSLGPVGVNVANSAIEAGWKTSSIGFAVVVPTYVGIFSLGFSQSSHTYRMKSATSDYVYGYMYQGGPAIIADGDNNIEEIPDAQTGFKESDKTFGWNWTFKGRTLENLGDDKMHPAYDMFTVESEGVSGTFRAFPREEQKMFNLISNYYTEKKENVEYYNPILELNGEKDRQPHEKDFFYDKNNQRQNSDYKYYKATPSLDAPFANYKTNFINEGNRMVYRKNKDSEDPLVSGMNFLFLGEGGYYESEEFEEEGKPGNAAKYGPGEVSKILLKRTLNKKQSDERQYALYGSRKVEPIFEDDSPVGKIKGFVITNSNGTKYFFTQPVKSYLKVDYTINQEKGSPVFVDRSKSVDQGFWSNLGKGIWRLHWPPAILDGIEQAISGHLDTKCGNGPSNEAKLYSYHVNMNPYATQWLLTEIQGPDYIQLNDDDMSQNIGYNVKFHYTKPILYQWRSPFAQPHAYWDDLPNFRIARNGMTPEGCDTKMYQAAFGVKEYVYLERIETATHRLEFEMNDPETEERVDGKGWFFDRKDKDGDKTLPILTTAAISLNVKSGKKNTVKNLYIDESKGKIISNEDLNEEVNANEYITFLNSIEKNKNIELDNWYEGKFEFDALFVNVEIPELLLENLKKNPKLTLETDYFKRLIHIGDEDSYFESKNSILFSSGYFEFEVDNSSIQMIGKTSGDESKYGLYKIKLKKGNGIKFFWRAEDKTLLNEAINGNVKLVLGQKGMDYLINGESNRYKLTQCLLNTVLLDQYDECIPLCYDKKDLPFPLFDWSDIVFAEQRDNPTMNQMRYLKKIAYYNKKSDKPYREYIFKYDYSLHPKTLNSYCKSRYPESSSDIQDSPLNANLDICKTDKTSRNLYGKLTLKSITEKGCQNGRCSSLPPFKFDYNVASQFSTKFSVKSAWEKQSRQNTPQIKKDRIEILYSSSSSMIESSSSKIHFFSEDYYDNITNIDASIIASINAIDEWGFWNIHGNENNHKVSQSFADYGGAAWSMNKITDPAGGVMEVKYERDIYKDGEDHANEGLTVPVFRGGKCSELISDYELEMSIAPQYENHTCALFLPMYLQEDCLGPRSAFWSYTPPKNHKGGMYDYMDSLGIINNNEINKEQVVFFNLHSELSTKVDCFILTEYCDRFRKVGLFGNAKILAKYDGKLGSIYNLDLPSELLPQFYKNHIGYHGPTDLPNARLLVLDDKYGMIEAGLQKAADKINDDLKWEFVYAEGDMWSKKEYTSMKGGDLRVKSLVRYDIDRTAKTEYEYESGEMAQLPDSAYTTVMGNGFNVNLWSFALPYLNLKPKSRIVGFEDDDLLYVPGATVMYPKVTVKNSEDKEKKSENDEIVANGKIEFEYITPEKGIPEEYIDSETKKDLHPFIRVNANFMTWGGNDKNKAYITRPCVITFDFYDYDGLQIGNSMNVLLQQNRTTSFSLYDNNIKNLSKIRATYQYYDDENPKNEPKTESMEMISVGPLTNFNEIMLSITHIEKKWDVYLNWQRSQELGYYPILYKEISYSNDEEIKLDKVEEGGDVIKEQRISPHFEKKIVYHDFTAFLGMNTKISTYRGNDDKAILLKVDSSVYSTRVPDVLDGVAEGTDMAGKIGKQVERWNSKRELQCVKDDDDCRRAQMSLSVRNSNTVEIKNEEHKYKGENITYYQDDESFEYKRYPVFQIASITRNGFDNQEKQFDKSSSSSYSSLNSRSSSSSCDDRCQRNQNRMHWNKIENHKYDPITSNPTATLAKIPAKDGGEIRKLTVKLPHHAVLNELGNSTQLANYMFKKNMLSQNYADFVYFDSEPVNSSTSWNNLEKVEYLKSFGMNPLNKYNGNLAYSNGALVESSKYPYVAWGSFTTKNDPVKIVKNGNPYTFVAEYHDVHLTSSSVKWPSKHDFLGNHILQVDRYFRPLETEDILNRKVSAHYSDDGLYQTGIFYPTERSKTAAIIPVGDDISEVNVSNSLKNSLKVDLNKGGMTVLSSIHLSCSIFHCGDNTLVAEYRVKKFGQNWQTERKNISEMDLTLSNGDILNYLRIYPENAEAKTYIYDRYGNIIQIVNEDNLSTYYEYNPLGQLIQTRNDDGVTFKSHHREFVNDNKNEIPWSESVYSSSSSGF